MRGRAGCTPACPEATEVELWILEFTFGGRPEHPIHTWTWLLTWVYSFEG